MNLSIVILAKILLQLATRHQLRFQSRGSNAIRRCGFANLDLQLVIGGCY